MRNSQTMEKHITNSNVANIQLHNAVDIGGAIHVTITTTAAAT